MTTLAPASKIGIVAGGSNLGYWATRALVYAAIVTIVLLSLPDGSALAATHWFGGTAFALTAAAVAALVAFACTEQRARMRGGRALGLAAVVLAVLCSLGALHAGGEIVSAAFAASFALALERRGRIAALVAVALTVVWCNVSPVGIIAPLIAAAFALGATSDDGARNDRCFAWYVAAACALATLATPALIALPMHAAQNLRIDRTLADIVAIHPADAAPNAYRIGFTLVVLAFLTFGSGSRVRAADAALVVFATLLALANGAYLAIFGVLVAPVLARSAYESLARQDARDATWGPGDFVLGAAALTFACAVAFVAVPRAEAALASQPYAVTKAFLASAKPHRVFCANPDWCGYVLANGPRGTSVLLDGRTGAYAPDAIVAQRTIAHVARGWRATLDRQRIDAMLVRRDRALATLLAMRADWHAVASDATAQLFVRTDPLQ